MKSATKHILYFLIIAFVCFFASESNALHDLFKDLDINKDGKIDRSEFSEDMKKDAFSSMDKDQNREITYEEWQGIEGVEDPDRLGELFKRMDKDRNKGITFFEFSDYADSYSNIEEAFIGLDKDRNNSLEPDEITVRPVLKWITIRF